MYQNRMLTQPGAELAAYKVRRPRRRTLLIRIERSRERTMMTSHMIQSHLHLTQS
jgi:hypothetical protein